LLGFGAEIVVLEGIEESGFGVDGSSEVDGDDVLGSSARTTSAGVPLGGRVYRGGVG
jgi:hypothetical protein